ncbi:MAG: hypothetical protein FWF04_04665, partial [Clostridiales bacterium]|nr:hypothetical protein [Clostridiales bacterium]
PGMPQYPDGELFVSVMDNSVLISVSGANEKSINDYLDALQAAGWDSEEDGAARQGYYVATKGDWRVRISFGDDNLTIMVIQN